MSIFRSYSVVIGLYKGEKWLYKIIDSCFNQSIKPKKIIIWNQSNTQNYDLIENIQLYDDTLQFISCNNYGVYARFSAALLTEADRYLILDDDTIPGSKWVENCYETLTQVDPNSILGYRGIRLKPDALYDVEAFEKGTTSITEVDLCGHAWFVTRKHILNMFEHKPVNYFNGEDTHLSAINQIKDGVKTYIPKQLISDPQTWGSTMQHLGAQAGRLSTSLGPHTHFKQREEVNKYWLTCGWKPICKR